MDENQKHETGSKQMAPKDVERDIISFYQQGLSVPELSIRYGISDKSIYYMFKKHGVPLRRRSGIGKKLSLAQEEDIVALYQQGIDAVTLASRYDVHSTTVYSVLERHGVKRRTNSDIFRKLSQEQEEEIIAFYRQGLAASTLASRYGIEDQTVYNILERHGVKRRSASQAAICICQGYWGSPPHSVCLLAGCGWKARSPLFSRERLCRKNEVKENGRVAVSPPL